MDLKETYNRIAEDWSQDHKADTWWQEGVDAFASYLKPGSTVLDVGCGDGNKSRYLISKGLRVAGVDFSEKLVGIARRDVPEGEFQVLDIYDLPSLDRTFDGVFASAVLLHVPKGKIDAVFRSLADKVNPGGHLYVAVKEMRPDQEEEKVIIESDYGYDYERFFSFYSADEIRKYFQDNGFEIRYEKIATVGKTNWIQMIGKKPI